jgi:hypothetical protein
MDTIIVSMRCGRSGRPFRVAFDASRAGHYAITSIAAGSGLTVTPAATGEPLLPSGGGTSTLTESVALADDLDWSALVCPFCGVHAPPTRCASCRAVLCMAAYLPPEPRLAFACPVCGWKQHVGGRIRWLPFGWLRVGRWRRTRPLRLEAGEMTALPAAKGLLGTAKRLLLPGPKRRPPQP